MVNDITEKVTNKIFEEGETNASEIGKLCKKLEAYRTALVKRGLLIARELSLDIAVSESPLHLVTHILVKRMGDKVDDSQIIDLARNAYPGIYTKYHEGLERLEVLMRKNDEFLDYCAKHFPEL